MLESRIHFDEASNELVLQALLSLPGSLEPTEFLEAEDEPAEKIASKREFLEKLKGRPYGYMLKSKNVSYHMSINASCPTICVAFFGKDSPASVRDFMVSMASARPMFGYAATEEERHRWNLIRTVRGSMSTDSWVGRDPRKYIPGLYWLTMLSGDLARRHGVALEELDRAAKEHVLLDEDRHLFRFYDRPEDWRDISVVSDLRSRMPGIFNIEALRPRVLAAKSWLEECDVMHPWP